MKMKFLSLMMVLVLPIMGSPLSVGGAEAETKKEAAKENHDAKAATAVVAVAEPKAEPKHVIDTECLASEEIIQDLEVREKALKQKDVSMGEREKELEAQKTALKEEMAKLELQRAEIQGIRGKELADREEKVNKLIETFETMSPKAAAQVIGKVDEELATLALSRLTTAKAGKILSVLDASKSSRLSELMAYGSSKSPKGKEKDSGESHQRSPASSR